MRAERKRGLLLAALPALVCAAGMAWLVHTWQEAYGNAAYAQIGAFCQILLSQEPEMENAVFSALKEYQNPAGEVDGGEWLEAYGYTAADFGAKDGAGIRMRSAVATGVCLAVFFLALWYQDGRMRGRIGELTRYLEQVNLGAEGTLLSGREDAFSILQDEVYKTVTNLRTTKEAAVKAKEQFAGNLANIAHQLKTPIAAAGLSLQLMEQKLPQACREQAQTVRKQLDRLNRLEEALLALSRMDSGTLQLEHAPVDVYTVLSLAAENLEGLREIQVEIPEKKGIIVWGDMEWLMEALMNLMKNGMEHSPAGGTIRCDYDANPLYVRIDIRDEGEGFAQEDLPHLFERFYRGQNASGDGLGLGLALARSIIEMHGGNITARNLPDGGACFEIRIYHNGRQSQ